MNPTDDEAYAELSHHFAEPLLGALQAAIQRLRDLNEHIVVNPDVPSTVVPEPLTVEVDIDDGMATIELCEVNSFIRVQVGGAPDGTDLVVDDSITVIRQRQSFVVEDGSWKMNDAERLVDSDQSC
jgi:hypothetical protein